MRCLSILPYPIMYMLGSYIYPMWKSCWVTPSLHLANSLSNMEKPCDTSKLFICTVLYPLRRQLYGTTICHGMSILLAPVIHVLFIQKARPTMDGPSTSANSYSFFYFIQRKFPCVFVFRWPGWIRRSCPLVQQRAVPVPAIFDLPPLIGPFRSQAQL